MWGLPLHGRLRLTGRLIRPHLFELFTFCSSSFSRMSTSPKSSVSRSSGFLRARDASSSTTFRRNRERAISNHLSVSVMNNDEINTELESFRQQWREEVRAKNPGARGQVAGTGAASSSAAPRQVRPSGPSGQGLSAKKKPLKPDIDEDYVRVYDFDELEATGPSSRRQPGSGHGKGKETGPPVTALEHYEEAVETEGQGNLGEALRLYKKAFRVSHLYHG